MTVTDIPFHFSVRTHPRSRTVHVAGELDVATSGRFTAAIETLQRAGDGDIAVHLDDLTLLDDAGLGAVVAACATQVVRGRSLTVHGLRPEQRRIFDLGGLGHLLAGHRRVRTMPFRRSALSLSA